MNSFNSFILLIFVAVVESREIPKTSQRLIKDSIISNIQGDSRVSFLTGDNSFGLNSLLSSSAYPRRELINLGEPSSHSQQQDKPCATVLTTSNCVIQVPEDALHKNIAERQFTLAFGLIKEQCSLTIRDCSGAYFTASNFLHGSICSTAVSVCCECNGCNRPPNEIISDSEESTTCAVLFEHERCSLCHGFRLQVGSGDKTMKMNEFVDNQVSSIYVMEGCELIIYQESDFQGFAALAQGSLDYLPPEWNDVISSFQCNCNTGASPTTPAPTSQTPTTTLIPIEVLTTTQKSEGTSSTIRNSEVPITTTTMATIESTTSESSSPTETEAAASTITTTPPPDITEPTTSTTEQIFIPIY